MEKLKRYSRPRKAENIDCGKTDVFEKKQWIHFDLGEECLKSCEGDKVEKVA